MARFPLAGKALEPTRIIIARSNELTIEHDNFMIVSTGYGRLDRTAIAARHLAVSPFRVESVAVAGETALLGLSLANR
ncbi:MAG: hypothetical protein AAF869_07680 [Pseudomonadota bacterium]